MLASSQAWGNFSSRYSRFEGEAFHQCQEAKNPMLLQEKVPTPQLNLLSRTMNFKSGKNKQRNPCFCHRYPDLFSLSTTFLAVPENVKEPPQEAKARVCYWQHVQCPWQRSYSMSVAVAPGWHVSWGNTLVFMLDCLPRCLHHPTPSTLSSSSGTSSSFSSCDSAVIPFLKF